MAHEKVETEVGRTDASPASDRIRDSFSRRARDYFLNASRHALTSKRAWALRGASLAVPGSGRVLGAGLAARNTWRHYDTAPRALTPEEKAKTMTRWMNEFHTHAHRNRNVRTGAAIAVASLGVLIGYGLLEAAGVIGAEAHAAGVTDIEHGTSGTGTTPTNAELSPADT